MDLELANILGLEVAEISQILSRADGLPVEDACVYFRELLGTSTDAQVFIERYRSHRLSLKDVNSQASHDNSSRDSPPTRHGEQDSKLTLNNTGHTGRLGSASTSNVQAPRYAAPAGLPPVYHHTNIVIEAARVRARDEQEMQLMLQNLQFRYGIYNPDVEPEHDTDWYCSCPIHMYHEAKYRRYPVQEMWSQAVMYPGEKSYNDAATNNYLKTRGGIAPWSRNPYTNRVISPYGYFQMNWGGPSRPQPSAHARAIHQTIDLNVRLNRQAQADIDAREPKYNIWADDGDLQQAMSNMGLTNDKARLQEADGSDLTRRPSLVATGSSTGKLSSFRKSIGLKSSTERTVDKVNKSVQKASSLRDEILAEESGRWPNGEWRQLVLNYQDKVGMTKKIEHLRRVQPIQYLHLLRAGYFEPIPVAWANQNSNPLKFTIDASAGWRGITPAWRGYEDTAEERLYWVLNHRDDPMGMTRTRLKPDFISEMNMARERMARAVEPPPLYFSDDDTCHIQHTSIGYSPQVAPPPLRIVDRPEQASDDTMILLDVSGSMDFDPIRPVYDQYLVTRMVKGTQPKNKSVAKAIIRRFTDAMIHHDHLNPNSSGYDLVTFSSFATYVGEITHSNLDYLWASRVRFGGLTRVMTGWQKCKELHFQKHSASATHHPIYGWQAGPETPILRLLLLLDGEASDMDEFELDLLSLSWAHVTIFLIGVEGCPHHHRHANELQRISDVNPHVSFVDAQGNTPERYVTHELLKRHLGYDVTFAEFEEMETLPPYSAT